MSYGRFEAVVDAYNAASNGGSAIYKWEAIPVTTDDGYELTMFHLWNSDFL